MKYRVGNKVRVRPDLVGGNEYPYSIASNSKLLFAYGMEKFRGRIYKITEATLDFDREIYELSLEVERGIWVFNDAMLLPINGLGDLICRKKNIK